MEVTGRDGIVRREYALNLSASGIALHVPRPLARGERVRLAFRLPDGGGRIEAAGRVVWSEEPVRTVRPRFREVGLRFEALGAADRARLLAYLRADEAAG